MLTIEAVIVLTLFILFYWPVWWMCWALAVAAIKTLLGLEEK